jgi:hypothetical protein
MCLVLIACGIFAYTASASANDQPRNDKEYYLKHGNKSRALKELLSKLKKHDDDDDDDDKHPIPIDPGKGDGKPTTPPTPQGPPGFVWVKDHWERARATSSGSPVVTTGTTTGTVVVRDHRKPYTGTDSSQASGGVTVTSSPIIRDHRTTPIIRDHRTTSGTPISGGTYGGVKITDSKRRPKSNSGGGILDTIGGAVSGAANGIGDVVGAAGHAVSGAAGSIGRGAGQVVDSVGDAVGLGGKSSSSPKGRVTVIRDHRK